jgi:predicted small metal-binding protein
MCSDLGFACEHVLEGDDEEQLFTLAREHAQTEHGEELDDERLRAAIRDSA